MLFEFFFSAIVLAAAPFFLFTGSTKADVLATHVKLLADNKARNSNKRKAEGGTFDNNANNAASQPEAGPSRQSNLNIKHGSFSAGAKKALEARQSQQQQMAPAPSLGEKQGVVRMRYRLRHCLSFWKTFCQSTLVLQWIEHGFDLRWITDPPVSKYMANHKSAFENSDIITETIKKLVDSGVMEPCDHQPYLVSPLGIVFKRSNNKPRMIFDARYLNSHIIVPSFKYEDLGYCHHYMQPGDYMVVTDYHSGYHHCDLHPDFWQYFGVEWEGNFYVFTSLPFGLASACWAFTKITRELLHKWRKTGHRCSGYIDDNMHCGTYYDLKTFVYDILVPDTEKAGFLFNEKSDFEPKTRQMFLGMFVDTVRRRFEVPPAKREILIALLQQSLRDHNYCSVHTLEILAGNLASMHWAFGPLSRLMTMSLYADISSAPSRFAHIRLSDTSIADMNFWLCGFNRYNGFNPIWQPVGFHMTLHTDAAGISLKNFGGWAGWTYRNGKVIVAKGIWSGDIILDHSTTQELFAIYNTVLSFNRCNELAGKRILVKTDNQAVYFIINRAGSRDSHVHELCKLLYWYCIDNNIHLVAAWIPRDLNTFADFYSKQTDSGDWKLNPSVFDTLTRQWGPWTIDLFASYDNHQTDSYYSYFFTPNCDGVDAFNYSWGRKCWCFPPFSLIARTLAHAKSCGARMCFVCPYTPTAPWWPTLTPDGVNFSRFVVDVVYLPKRPNLLLAGRVAHNFTHRVPRWDFLALLLDFAHPRGWGKDLQIPNRI